MTITRAELDSLRARATAANAVTTPADQPDPVAAGTQSARIDDLTREIASRDRRLAELERSYKTALCERELATTLAGKALVPGAAVQLVKLWREEFDVHEHQGRYQVRSRDGRPLADVIQGWLSSAEYSHFCLPSSRGGTGARDAHRPTNTTPTPRNLGEAVLIQWREAAATRPGNGLKPVGLRRHR